MISDVTTGWDAVLSGLDSEKGLRPRQKVEKLIKTPVPFRLPLQRAENLVSLV